MLNTKKILLICSVIVLVIASIICINKITINNINYNYEEELKLKNKDSLQSNEDDSITYTKSSLFYNLNSINFTYDKKTNEIIDLDSINYDEEIPLMIKSIQCKNNGFFIAIEFKDSGAVIDFKCKITIGDYNYVIKEPIIDCSNEFKIYVPYSLPDGDVKINLSNFYWKGINKYSSTILDEGMIDDEGQVSSSHTSTSIEKNGLLFGFNYNSLTVKNKFNPVNYLIKLKNSILGNSKYLYVVFFYDNSQVDSAKINLNKIKNHLIYVDTTFNKIKLIEEENNG